MIDLLRSASASPLTQMVPIDPGNAWVKDELVAIDAPPDGDADPSPEAVWPANAKRSGMYGVVGPRIITLPDGRYRLYYTQISPRVDFPAGANDYGNATSRILSAISSDGSTWTPEPGVRLTPQAGGAGDFRVVSSEVVPVAGQSGRLRMYYECCDGQQGTPNSIRSATSADGGLLWTPEMGARLGSDGGYYSAPRILFLDDGRCRLYCCERGTGIVSALSDDGGLTFHREPGVRIAPGNPYDSLIAFAPEILQIEGVGFRMYYAGYSASNRAYILSALSQDGLRWEKQAEPIVSPGEGHWDAAKCSEMCIIRLPERDGQAPRYRMLYEACDGTTKDKRGVWRIASAISV
jgi:predicted GH43/DUF377 family glycosyl hydrolase